MKHKQKDTICIVFEKEFRNNNIEIFVNNQLIEQETVTTKRKHGLLYTGYGKEFVVDREQDNIVIKCGIWSIKLNLEKAHTYIYIRRLWGLGIIWADYPNEQKKFR